MPEQRECDVWGDEHRWVYQREDGCHEHYECACGRGALDVGDWPDKQIIIEPAEEAEQLGALPAWDCEHGTADPDDPNDPCIPCAVAS